MQESEVEDDEASGSGSLQNIGARLRAMRQKRAQTLETLAARAKLSKSYLSRLEDGDRQPSIAALLSLSRALETPLSTLLADEATAPQIRVVRASESIAVQGNGLFYQAHSGGLPGAVMQPLRVTIPAGRTGDELYRHEGEEWLYVLSGELRVTLGDDIYDLGAGDSLYFPATVGHRLAAKGRRDVEAILVASIAPAGLLTSYL